MSASEETAAEPEHREVWLAIPGPQPGTVWADTDGRLPFQAFDLPAGATTVAALQHDVLPGLGVGGPILACLLKYDEPWTPATLVSGLAELDPQPSGWSPPRGWRAVDLTDPAVATRLGERVRPDLQHRLVDWAAEQQGAPLDRLTPPWSRSGWWARATQWVAEQLPGSGPLEVEQVRAWGISTVLRATDANGIRHWFKAVCEHFGREVAITEVLDGAAPGFVAPVLAADRAQLWLLLGDLPDVTAEDPTSHTTAYPRLRDLQRSLGAAHAELVAAGAMLRPLSAVPAAFAEVMADPELAPWHGRGAERVAELVAWVQQAVEQVDALGLPDVFVHGDFHPGNVATLPDGTRVIFDWSDAAITVPFVDVPTWLTWLDDDPDERTRVWESFAAGWRDVLPADEWLARRSLFEGVAGAFHVVSYAGIVRSMDKHRKDEHGRGITDFVAFVDAAAAPPA